VTKKVYAPGLIVLLSAICLASIASAQMSWWRTYGGTYDDWGYSVQQTADGGYIVTGQTTFFGADDVYLVKINAQGDTLWTRTYGGIGGRDVGKSVQQTSDGGYVITGHTTSFGHTGDFDVYLIKTDSSGDTLWTRAFGEARYDDEGNSVQQTTDGGYIVAGYNRSFGNHFRDFWLLKSDAQGDTLWTKSYGGPAWDVANSVQQTADGGYIVTGLTYSFGAGYNDFYLVRTDSSGDTLWTRTYGGRYRDEANFVQQTTDGGYIIAGRTYSFGTGTPDYANVYLIKTDSSGDTLWTRTYGGSRDDAGFSAQQTVDGGYIVTGWTYSFGPGTPDSDNVYLIKTDSSGDTLWTATYGGTRHDDAYSVQQTADSGYIIAGRTFSFGAGYHSDVYVIKTDGNGYVGIEEPLTRHPARPSRCLVQPSPFTSFARVPGHETEFFALSDITGRQVAICKGDRVGEGLRPGVYFMSPVGLKTGKTATATIVKTVF
jgi:hypothetical protein